MLYVKFMFNLLSELEKEFESFKYAEEVRQIAINRNNRRAQHKKAKTLQEIVEENKRFESDNPELFPGLNNH